MDEVTAAWREIKKQVDILNELYHKNDLNEIQPESAFSVIPMDLGDWSQAISNHIEEWESISFPRRCRYCGTDDDSGSGVCDRCYKKSQKEFKEYKEKRGT